MLCEVVKPFKAAGVFHERGAVVDPSTWRTCRQLIDQRYMRPIDEGPPTPRTRLDATTATDKPPQRRSKREKVTQ